MLIRPSKPCSRRARADDRPASEAPTITTDRMMGVPRHDALGSPVHPSEAHDDVVAVDADLEGPHRFESRSSPYLTGGEVEERLVEWTLYASVFDVAVGESGIAVRASVSQREDAAVIVEQCDLDTVDHEAERFITGYVVQTRCANPAQGVGVLAAHTGMTSNVLTRAFSKIARLVA